MKSGELALLVNEWRENGLDAEIDADPSLEALAIVKLAILAMKDALKDAETKLDDVMYDAIPPRGEHIPGVGLIEQQPRSKSLKWDSEAVIDRLFAQSLDERQIDEETGEVERSASALMRVLKDASGIANPSHQWRKGALKRRGIDPKDYSESAGWTRTVRLTVEAPHE